MTQHTPGPWNHSQESIDPDWWIVTLPGGLVLANVNAHAHQEANARLIAAAPNLLAALIDLLGDQPLIQKKEDSFDGYHECTRCGREYGNEDVPEHCSEDCPGEIARAAIARATGAK